MSSRECEQLLESGVKCLNPAMTEDGDLICEIHFVFFDMREAYAADSQYYADIKGKMRAYSVLSDELARLEARVEELSAPKVVVIETNPLAI